MILLGFVSKSDDEFKLVGEQFTEEPYGIGVAKDDTEFRDFINDVLEEIFESGEWAEAYESTVGTVDEETPEPDDEETDTEPVDTDVIDTDVTDTDVETDTDTDVPVDDAGARTPVPPHGVRPAPPAVVEHRPARERAEQIVVAGARLVDAGEQAIDDREVGGGVEQYDARGVERDADAVALWLADDGCRRAVQLAVRRGEGDGHAGVGRGAPPLDAVGVVHLAAGHDRAHGSANPPAPGDRRRALRIQAAEARRGPPPPLRPRWVRVSRCRGSPS